MARRPLSARLFQNPDKKSDVCGLAACAFPVTVRKQQAAPLPPGSPHPRSDNDGLNPVVADIVAGGKNGLPRGGASGTIPPETARTNGPLNMAG